MSNKDRYLELSLSEELPERRTKTDRRAINTVLDPSIEKRRRNRRHEITRKKRKMEQKKTEKQKKERRNFLFSMFMLSIPSSIFAWYGIKIIYIVINYFKIALDKGFLF